MVTAHNPAIGLRIPGTIGLKDLVPLLLILYLSNGPAIPWYGYVSMLVLSVALFVWANWSNKTDLLFKAFDLATIGIATMVLSTFKSIPWYAFFAIMLGVGLLLQEILLKIAKLARMPWAP